VVAALGMNGHGIENHQQPIPHTLSHWGSHFRPGTRASARAASRAGTRTAAAPTADQKRVLQRLKLFDDAADWRGVAEQERAATAVAVAVRTSMPGNALFV
jgi:hypothetical protein